LFYGITFTEEEEESIKFPWFDDDEGIDMEEWFANKLGICEPDSEYSSETHEINTNSIQVKNEWLTQLKTFCEEINIKYKEPEWCFDLAEKDRPTNMECYDYDFEGLKPLKENKNGRNKRT